MATAQAAKSQEDYWGLNWHLQWGIYKSILTWTHSQNSQAAGEALSLKISCHGTSLKWSQKWSRASNDQEWSNKHENCHELYDEMEHPVLSLKERQ